MKYLIALSLLTLLSLLSSCSKTYTCGCSDGTENIVYEEEINAADENEAKDKCSSKGVECWLI